MKYLIIKVSHENIPQLHTLVVNYFRSIESIKNNEENKEKKYKLRVINKRTEKELINEIGEEIFEKPMDTEKRRARLKSQLSFHSAGLLMAKTQKLKRNVLLRKDVKKIRETEKYKSCVDYFEKKSICLEPRVENRSVMIENDEVINVKF